MPNRAKSKAEKAGIETEQAENPIDPAAPAEPVIPGTVGVIDSNVTADAMAANLGAVNVTDPNVNTGDDSAKEPPRKARRGHQLLRYTGYADVVTHGEIRFRRGEIVEVSKDDAEELLTLPLEEFEVVTMEAEGDDG